MSSPGPRTDGSPGPDDKRQTKARDTSSQRTVAIVVILAIVILVAGVAVLRSSDDGSSGGGQTSGAGASPDASSAESGAKPKVTFVELGSTTCIPCKEMRPVMAAVEKAFGDQVEVVFYDVNEDSAPAEQYGIRYIPTQVFLDADGKEFHRHVGFYPYEDIEALLLDQGLTRVSAP
jgi:thioredoxin 1